MKHTKKIKKTRNTKKQRNTTKQRKTRTTIKIKNKTNKVKREDFKSKDLKSEDLNLMSGGKSKQKKCMCVDFEKKGSAFINYEHGNKCARNVVPGTDFCDKHQDCMGFSKQFLNKYELEYNPELWNKSPNVKNSHNCYTYFLDSRVKPVIQKCKNLTDEKKKDKCGDLKPQPGDFYMLVNNGTLENKNRNYSCKEMIEKILNDNPSIQQTTFDKKCPVGSYKGAMVVDPGNTYHFYRQNADGTWSHKPGVLDVTNVDSAGNKIYFPHTAARKYDSSGINYTDFCSYFCIPKQDRVNMYAI